MIYYRDGKWQAFNRLTHEHMEEPVYPRLSEYNGDISAWYKATYHYVSAMKLWDAFVATCPPDITWQRPKLVHAEEKGVPLPGTGKRARRKYKNGAGISANSHILSHRYADEGEKGRTVRREIRRKENILWRREWETEMAEAFEDSPFWDNSYDDYYDDSDMGCGDLFCEICGDFEYDD